MDVILYQFNKRYNSTKKPDATTKQLQIQNVNLKAPTSMYNPIFIIESTVELSDYNYLAYRDKRYFITNLIYLQQGIFEIHCTIDVLSTYKEEIGNSSQFIEYSATKKDVYLIDNRLSMAEGKTKRTVSKQGIRLAQSWLTSFYTLTFVTSSPTLGGAGVGVGDINGMRAIAAKVASTDFADWIENQVKSFTGAYDSIVGCKAIPVTEGLPADYFEVVLGNYPTGLQLLRPPEPLVTYTDWTVPFPTSDFTRFAPYTTLKIYLPCYGYVDLNPNLYAGGQGLRVYQSIDFINGDLTYIIDGVGRFTVNIAVDVPIGTVSNNALKTAVGVLGGAVAMAAAPLTGGASIAVGAGALSIGSSLMNFNTQVSNSGGVGGMGSVQTNLGSQGDLVLEVVTSSLNVGQSTLNATNGTPFRQVDVIKNHAGFVQTINASVNAPCGDVQIQQINQLMDGGFFYE